MENDIILEQDGIRIRIQPVSYQPGDKKNNNQYYSRESHIYVGIQSESVFDNLQNRKLRPYTIWKKELLPEVARIVEQQTEFNMRSKKSWNQYLGCSCPCSPGFKTQVLDGNGNPVALNIWITI
jgi:hypothetical protein